MIRRVVGNSMQPSLKPGAIVIGWRFKRPSIGDLVIANVQGQEIIKRVQQFNQRGLYLVGDNTAASIDSREFGWLQPTTIKSVVIGVFNNG